MQDQLLDTWVIHNRIHLYVLDAIAPDALSGVSASQGRSVGEQFAHIHNVRLMWLQSAAPNLLPGLEKVEKTAVDKDRLCRSLEQSGQAIESLLKRGFEAGKIKGFKPHPAAFLGYLIAHESYHRGEIGIILAQSGHPLDKKIAFGMWEWGAR
ncbi:MAG: hypothetical protein IT324_03655 [Anaerolineae bacterium]|nr:hypothetical protein [Anaerolineae bacterium]